MEIIDTNILPSIITGFILKETKSNYQPSAPNKQEKRILMAPPCRLIPRFPRQVVEAQKLAQLPDDETKTAAGRY